MDKEIRTITARDVVEMCKNEGQLITVAEAQIVLDFMYKFSKLTLEILLKDEEC